MTAALPREVDVAIVGGGAAGIAAARRLAAAGRVSLIVLEARGRVGGRVHTVAPAGLPLDRGAEWLHSADRNPLTAIAEGLGFAVHRRPPEWTSRLQRSGATAAEEADWLAIRDAHRRRLAAAGRRTEDGPLSQLLGPDRRWHALLDATSSWANGAELDRVSIIDNARYEDSGVNFRLEAGYGRLFERLAEGLPVTFDAAVARIDHRGTRLRLETSRGTLEAARAIVTVPTTIIAAARLRFDPPLPDKLAAAAALPLGLANKAFLALDAPVADAEFFLVGSTTRRETGSYQVAPFGRAVVYGFFGGSWALALEQAGPTAMAAFAIDELAAVLGSDIRRRLTPLATTAWAQDPWALGSYSYAAPGRAEDRAILAAPVGGRLFFAGEATSPNFFSTAHGAWISGIAAAEAALASLVRDVPSGAARDSNIL